MRLKTWVSDTESLFSELLVNLENFCIFLKAFESLEIELPILEKSMLLKLLEFSLGVSNKFMGVFCWANLFFF